MDSPDDIDEALFIAIQQNERYKVSEWFKKYSSEHIVTTSWSPVHEAAINGHTEILWDLLHRYDFSAEDHFELEPSYDEVYATGRELKEVSIMQWHSSHISTCKRSHGYG